VSLVQCYIQREYHLPGSVFAFFFFQTSRSKNTKLKLPTGQPLAMTLGDVTVRYAQDNHAASLPTKTSKQRRDRTFSEDEVHNSFH
jgi:hypothetical protein